MAPAQPQQGVEHGLLQVPLIAVLLDPDRAVALGQLGTVSPMDQRDMAEGGQIPARGLINLRLAKGVVEVIVTPDDVGDAHVVVVDAHGEHVGWRAIGTEQDEVVNFAVLDLDPALHHVVDDGAALLRGSHADDEGRPVRCLGGIAVAPASVVARVTALGLGRLAHGAQFLGRGEALVGPAVGEHFLGDGPVTVGAGALEHRLSVGIQPHPVQPGEDGVDRFLRRAFLVGILYSK